MLKIKNLFAVKKLSTKFFLSTIVLFAIAGSVQVQINSRSFESLVDLNQEGELFSSAQIETMEGTLAGQLTKE